MCSSHGVMIVSKKKKDCLHHDGDYSLIIMFIAESTKIYYQHFIEKNGRIQNKCLP